MSGRILSLLLVILLALPAAAEIYQWRDDQGRLHFGDKPARNANAKPVALEQINTMTPVYVPQDQFNASSPDRSTPHARPLPRIARGSVVMYSTPTCTFCGMARDYMKRKGIPFREKNISASKSARREFLAYGGRGVPLIFIGTARGTQKVHGFSEARFEAAFDSR